MTQNRVFLFEHIGVYHLPDADDHSEFRIRELISSKLYDEFNGLCEVYPLLFNKDSVTGSNYNINCTVVLDFNSTHNFNTFKLKFMSHLDDMVEIESHDYKIKK